MNFPAILLFATVVTGGIWLGDRMILSRKRAAGSAEPMLVEMAKSFFPVILVVFLLRSFLAEPFRIPSGSMLPSLHIGDFILVNKFSYGIRLPVVNKKVIDVGQPQHGDVMVFRHPDEPSKDLIKRVIGLPGDVVTYRGKRLTINGQAMDMEMTGTFTEVEESGRATRYDTYREKLGTRNHIGMLNPAHPTMAAPPRFTSYRDNCRYDVNGFTCTVPAGHYLMMGDSRDNSDDGRYWGFVPDENIVGKAFFVWMNFSALKRIGTKIE
jgi:signal peptidase I